MCSPQGLPKGGGCGTGTIYRKGVLDALCLTFRNLAVPQTVVKHQSNNDVHGCVISDKVLLTATIGCEAILVVYIHIGVGFGVARFDNWAMPEPLKVGRVTGDSHASFYM